MSDPVYLISVGSGLYINDQGVLHTGPVPPVPVYPIPGGTLSALLQVQKFAKTFKDIGNSLPDPKDKAKFAEFADKLAFLGLPNGDLAKLFGVIGTAVKAIGTVFAVVGAAVALAEMLGIFSQGPSPLELLIKARFDALDIQNRALRQLNVQERLNDKREALTSARSTVEDFVSRRDSGTMTPTQIGSELQTLSTALSLLSANQIIGLLNPATYTVLFDQEQYLKVWPWISGHLFRVPGGTAPQVAAFPAVNTPVFDHRMAVLLAPQAAQTFLVLVRSLYPEFRTTGNFRPTLRDFADKLTNLAATIRNTALARTIYHEGDFGYQITDFYVHDPLPGILEPVLKQDFTLVVGAMDLCNHDDAFFPDVTKAQGPPPGPSRRGSIDFRWHPPAKIARDPVPSGMVHNDGTPVLVYRITNQKECADAANDLSLQDYSDLLLSSGYLTIMQIAAQMRHATTQPAKSETVRGDVLLQRNPQDGAVVTVVSAPGPIIFAPSGTIQASAWREPQKIRANVYCTTQQIPRTPPLIHYRVLLRTLASAHPPGGWSEPDYGTAIQSVSYIADPLHPGFQRLNLSTSFAAMLQEELLIEGSTEAGSRHVDREVTLRAHTFDWWIPVKPHHTVSIADLAAATDRNVFGNATPLPPVGLPKVSPKIVTLEGGQVDIATADAAVSGIGWEDGVQTWEGRHRETEDTTVKMRVRLEWRGSKMRVTIDNNRPQDRNYIVFLVLEETFGSIESDEQMPKVLHTAFPIPINGRLTYVPQSLFDEEKEAAKKQRGFAERFAISVKPKIGQPVFGRIAMRDLATDAGAAHLAATLRKDAPELLESLIRKPATSA